HTDAKRSQGITPCALRGGAPRQNKKKINGKKEPRPPQGATGVEEGPKTKGNCGEKVPPPYRPQMPHPPPVPAAIVPHKFHDVHAPTSSDPDTSASPLCQDNGAVARSLRGLPHASASRHPARRRRPRRPSRACGRRGLPAPPDASRKLRRPGRESRSCSRSFWH